MESRVTRDGYKRRLTDKFAGKREKLVNLLKEKGITDERVLESIGSIPRQMFMEHALEYRAYEDLSFPIGRGQTISRPYTVALMTQLAKLAGSEICLEVGTGSGYQAAVLSGLVEKLYTIERHNVFSNRARKIFNEMGLSNVACLVGDGTIGAKSYGPFDVIMVTAGGPKICEPLALQLKDGGRMVAPVVEEGQQCLHVIRRNGNSFKVSKGESCSFVPLVGVHGFKG